MPSEFEIYQDEKAIPWDDIVAKVEKSLKRDGNSFHAITNSVASLATKESMRENPNPRIIAVGMHACLIRGRISEALYMSNKIQDIEVLALRAIVLFTL